MSDLKVADNKIENSIVDENDSFWEETNDKKRKQEPLVTPQQMIRGLVELYYDAQDYRIASANRLRQYHMGEPWKDPKRPTFDEVLESVDRKTGLKIKGSPIDPAVLKKGEELIAKQIEYLGRQVSAPMFERLTNVKGIGPVLAGGLLAYFDPEKAKHPSSFWKYAGLHVVEGKAIRRARGNKVDFNPRLRVLAYKIGDSFLKQRTQPYRQIYDDEKSRQLIVLKEEIENTKSGKIHVELRARRKMVKAFLADFWFTYREIKGLPTNSPYANDMLHHELERPLGLPKKEVK